MGNKRLCTVKRSKRFASKKTTTKFWANRKLNNRNVQSHAIIENVTETSNSIASCNDVLIGEEQNVDKYIPINEKGCSVNQEIFIENNVGSNNVPEINDNLNLELEIVSGSNDMFVDEELSVEPEISNIETKLDICGRRFVNITYFWKQLQSISVHSPFQCSINDMDIIKETRKGLISVFKLQCKMCKMVTDIETDTSAEKNIFNINSATVLGTISTGCGFSQLEEFCTAVDVPAMSNRTYNTHHEKVGHVINATAIELMKNAAIEEAEIARKLGDVDQDGYPLVTVVADAAWCTRSYNKKYSSASGVACIIGQATGKLLFLGIRNKYCAMCAMAHSRNMETKEHQCFKNWTGSSTSMEADIIVEGFNRSKDMHGLIYHKLVGDGDSSVSKKLLQNKPYGAMLVEKVECCNHLLRNYGNKLAELSKTTRLGNNIVPRYLRTAIGNSILRLRCAVEKAAEKRRNEEGTTLAQKIKLLSDDILNSPSHVFGEHAKCAEIGYFCNGLKPNEENLVPKLIEAGLYQEIKKYLHRLAYNASSLLLNMTNNSAEHYNSIVAKFVGGKRINFSKKGSYQIRCEAAAISFNAKEEYLRKVLETANRKNVSKYLERFVRKRQCKRIKEAKRRLQHKKKLKRRKVEKPDQDYGEVNTEFEDMPPFEFEFKKTQFLNSIKKSISEVIKLEKDTRGQNSNPIWKSERAYRLTASKFGKICKLKKTTSCVNIVKELIYKHFSGTKATNYGLENESNALNSFQEITGLVVQECGLFIEKNLEYFMGASPDGIISSCNAILEIKCPYKIFDTTPTVGAKLKLLNFLHFDESTNVISLKNNHDFMYQVQGQLHITGAEMCYFVVWSPKETFIQKINKDESFWITKMEKPLKTFFYKCLLPEIVDPRYNRSGGIIRNPDRTDD